jgi:hypothetical protein
MMFNVTKIALVAALGLFISLIAMQAVASDRSVRCGTYLIYAGGGKDSASMYEVLKKCGEPEAKNGNNWIYIQGSMLRVLTFNYQGRLQTIESERK